jgi:uncharacterized protein (TIGR03083 family)
VTSPHGWDRERAAATARLAAVASTAPDAPVPTCPGWTVARVAVHTGRIHRWVAAALTAPDGTEVPPAPRPAPETDLGGWLVEGGDLLTVAFEAAGPGGAVRAPGWERSAPWWRRRTCHETVVHAWDVEAAVGVPTSIDGQLAVDGIDEVVEVFLPTAFDLDAFGEPATLHLHATDDDLDGGEWLVAVGSDGVRSERRHAKGDVAVRGSASDLLLWAWGRVPTSALDVMGDADVAERYLAATRY